MVPAAPGATPEEVEAARREMVRDLNDAAHYLMKCRKRFGPRVGGGLLGWLANGGNLAKDHFGVVIPKSHRTAQKIWLELYPDAEGDPHLDEDEPDIAP